jgi:radical SAM protein with 4Fe4S-binding SPASM domain
MAVRREGWNPYTLARNAAFTVKVTEGFHYRRYEWQRRRDHAPQERLAMRPAVNAGKGHVFVSSTGDVYPSGFLPVRVGNIREHALAALYQDAPVMRALRDPARLKGRCGICEYRTICGGSRARAYAMTGDYLAEEPYCVYRPGATAHQEGPNGSIDMAGLAGG